MTEDELREIETRFEAYGEWDNDVMAIEAPGDVERLIAEVRRLRAENDNLRRYPGIRDNY